MLILLTKQILEPQFCDPEILIKLGVEEETLKMIHAFDFDFKSWITKIKENVTKEDDGLVIGGNSKALKTFLIDGLSSN